MSAKKLPSKVTSADEIMYGDVSLIRKYSVLEIAMLAAGCRGDTRLERISDAVELLALVERYALAGKETRLRILQRKENGGAPLATSYCDASKMASMIQSFECSVEICEVAERGKAGKIKLTSLVGLAYEAGTGGKPESSEAMRSYSDWATEEASEEGIGVASYKARYSKGKPAVLHDDATARHLIMQFLVHLSKRPVKPATEIIQSQKIENKGQIVSPSTRGAARNDRGKFAAE